jgi:hypothetical protein
MDSWDSAKDANNAARLRAYLAENSLTPERKKELAFEKQATKYKQNGLSSTYQMRVIKNASDQIGFFADKELSKETASFI